MIAMLAVTAALATGQPEHAVEPCHTRRCEVRVERKHWRRAVRSHRVWLMRTATCESSLGTGRPKWHINTGNGFFGGLQFTLQSWAGVGGIGYPHKATPLEQMYRGVLLLNRQGRNAWPVCGR